jgi:hypothetical protein
MPPKKELPIRVIPSEKKPLDKRLDDMKFKETLPVIPSNIAVLGQCGSGKSCWLYSLLADGYVDSKGHSVFDEIIVFLGSMDANETFEKLPCKNVVVMNDFDPAAFQEYIEDLREHQMERLNKGKPRLNICIVFDDFVGKNIMKPLKGSRTSILENVMLTSRHELNCSVLYCSQVYKSPCFTIPSVRNNINYWVIYQMTRREIMRFAEEHSGFMTPKQFVEWYDECMKDKYNFVMVNYKKALEDRYTERFTNVFYPSKILERDAESSSEESSSDSD